MRLTIVAVGKLRPALRDAADDYLRRLSRYTTVTEVEVREAGRAPTAADSARQESARVRERIAVGDWIVVLDRMGKAWTSEELARRVDGWRAAARPVAVVIGGSHGLASSLVRDASESWSLGPITLPHELARVVALEQLYRAWTILRGEKYHK